VVVDAPSGEALPGVAVFALVLSRPDGIGESRSDATTDEAGTARLSVPPGRAQVTARTEDRPASHQWIRIRPGEPNHVRIELPPGVTLRGSVVEAGTGTPLEGVRIQVAMGGGQAETDEQGRFELHGLGSPVFLTLAAPRHVGLTDVLQAPAAGGAIERRYELPPGGAVSGLVLDTRGEPVEGALVGQELDPYRGVPRNGSGTTDAAGRFELGGLAPSDSVVLHAVKEGLARGKSRPLVVKAGEKVTGVVVRLNPVRGLVLVPRVADGSPLPPSCRAQVFLEGPGRGAAGPRVKSTGGPEWIRDGEIRLWGLPEGEFHLVVRAGQYVSRVLRSTDLPSPSSAEVPRVPVLLEKGLAIRGRVLDIEGRPQEGTYVLCSHSDLDGLVKATQSGPEGRFAFAGLLPGEYKVESSLPGSQMSCRADAVPAGTVDLVLRPSGGTSLSGEVLDPEGEPASASVTAWRSRESGSPPRGPERARDRVSTRVRGRFHLDLDPGIWWVAVRSDTWSAPEPVRVDIRPGANRVGAIRLGRPASITGVVRGADGPLAGAVVLAWPAGFDPGHLSLHFPEPLMAVAYTDAEGEFTVTPLGVGRWAVLAGARGHVLRPLEVVVGQGNELTHLDIALTPGGYLVVEPEGPDGEPIPGGLLLRFPSGEMVADSFRRQLREELEEGVRPSRAVALNRTGPHAPGVYTADAWASFETSRGKVLLRRIFEVRLRAGEVTTIPVSFDHLDVDAALWLQERRRQMREIRGLLAGWKMGGDAADLDAVRRLLADLKSQAPEGLWEAARRQIPGLEGVQDSR
jgi:protocatechuate 3,4-dioxygenase beta subunit